MWSRPLAGGLMAALPVHAARPTGARTAQGRCALETAASTPSAVLCLYGG